MPSTSRGKIEDLVPIYLLASEEGVSISLGRMSYFIVAISNGGGAPEQAYRKMQNAGACPEAPYAEMFKFEVPSLMVGTLDSLMVSDATCDMHLVINKVVPVLTVCCVLCVMYYRH